MDQLFLPQTDWDVVVSGTGVQESLMAIALSRAGLSVLQLDRNAYYGSSEAAFMLDELETWVSTLPATSTSLSNPHFAASISHTWNALPRGYTISLAPHIVYWDSALLGLLRNVEMTTSFTWQAMGSWWVYLTDKDVEQRPAGSSGLSGALVGAGMKVAKAGGTMGRKAGWNKNRKSAPAAPAAADLFSAPEDLPELKPRPVGDDTALRKLGSTLREVPCTFEDVAWSDDLHDRDRGYLGGFLRFVTKCMDPTDTKHPAILAEHANTSLEKFLSTVFPLPPATIAALHSLTLLPTPPAATPLAAAIPRLIAHFSSLGRISDIRSSAALTIAYGGSSELCQIWSRGAAVAGGLNVLERHITSIEPTPTDSKLSLQLSSAESITCSHLITPSLSAATEVHSKGIYILSSPLSALFAKKHAEDRMSPSAVLLTFPARCLAIPGTELTNENPLYALLHSSGTLECPAGHVVGYLSTLAGGNAEGTVEPLFDAAVGHLLTAAGDGETVADTVKLKCIYQQLYPKTLQHVEKAEPEPETKVEATADPRIINLQGLPADLVFADTAVEECMSVYEKIIGTKEGFCAMSEKMRREMEGAEE
ncbi:hypothetical protein EDC01DRAFT_643717 [Geopyxis carbonaria]|nr:hypothetical protein EDC01DRAFT_643717 [Geopyxis carbonaria]